MSMTGKFPKSCSTWPYILIKEGMNVLSVNPSTNDECGLLVDSFDIPPVMLMPYNPEYYKDLVTSYGFTKAKDLIAFDIDRNVIKDEKMMQKLERVADMIMKRENITFRNVNLKDFKNEVQKVREIYNDAWSRNWGFVPMTEEEFNFIADHLKMIKHPDFIQFAEHNGNPIGFSLAVPDINLAIKGLNGKLFPFWDFQVPCK